MKTITIKLFNRWWFDTLTFFVPVSTLKESKYNPKVSRMDRRLTPGRRVRGDVA